ADRTADGAGRARPPGRLGTRHGRPDRGVTVVPPERRTRTDLTVAVLIVLVVLAAATALWWRSDARATDSSPAQEPLAAPAPAARPRRVSSGSSWRPPPRCGAAAAPAPPTPPPRRNRWPRRPRPPRCPTSCARSGAKRARRPRTR